MEWHQTYGSFELHRAQLEALDQALADRILAALPHPRLSFALEYTLYQGDRRRTVDHPGAIGPGVRLDALTLRLRLLKDWSGLTEQPQFQQERQAVHQAGHFLQDLGLRFTLAPSAWAEDGIEAWVIGEDGELVQELGEMIEAWLRTGVQRRRSGRQFRRWLWLGWSSLGVGSVGLGVLLGWSLLGSVAGAIGAMLLGGSIALLGLAYGGQGGFNRVWHWLWSRDRPNQFRF